MKRVGPRVSAGLCLEGAQERPRPPLARIARQGQAIIESETQLFLWAAEVAARVDCRVPSLSLCQTPKERHRKVREQKQKQSQGTWTFRYSETQSRAESFDRQNVMDPWTAR